MVFFSLKVGDMVGHKWEGVGNFVGVVFFRIKVALLCVES